MCFWTSAAAAAVPVTEEVVDDRARSQLKNITPSRTGYAQNMYYPMVQRSIYRGKYILHQEHGHAVTSPGQDLPLSCFEFCISCWIVGFHDTKQKTKLLWGWSWGKIVTVVIGHKVLDITLYIWCRFKWWKYHNHQIYHDHRHCFASHSSNFCCAFHLLFLL